MPVSQRLCGGVLCVWLLLVGGLSAAEPTWKAGVAKAVITPTKPLWMAGYGGRTAPAEGKHHDLWIRVLALEDAAGRKGVILSSDTLGIPRGIYTAVCAELKSRQGLDPAQIMLHASHTHCGPVLSGALHDIYPLDDQQRALIDEYSTWLTAEIVKTIEEAIANLQPATVSRGEGLTDFGVNRRRNPESEVPRLRSEEKLVGPNDPSVPVLAVHDASGKLTAVFFLYACHNTTLSFNLWCGDYAGFAEELLEERHPGAAALFGMGCGADQNPLPRRTMELAKEYGRRLADAVDAVLAGPLTPLRPTLQMELEIVPLVLGPPPTREELTKLAAGSGYTQRWGARLLKELDAGPSAPREYPYPVQAWRLGGQQLWITLGGEVVVDYSLRLKAQHGTDAWVSGYTNDVMAYIPSYRVLLEGGYEGQSSMMVYGQPAHRWAEDVEERVVGGVERLVERLTAK